MENLLNFIFSNSINVNHHTKEKTCNIIKMSSNITSRTEFEEHGDTTLWCINHLSPCNDIIPIQCQYIKYSD